MNTANTAPFDHLHRAHPDGDPREERGPIRVTRAIVITLVVIFLADLIGFQDERFRDAGVMLASPASLAHEPWRALSAALLHANGMHLGMNVAMFWSLGNRLEALLGGRRLLVLFLLSALGGSVCTALVGAGGPRAGHLGASGAVWGTMASLFIIARWRRDRVADEGLADLVRPLWISLGINTALSFLPGISLTGHLGGALVGGALTASNVLFHGLSPHAPDAPPPRWVTALALLLVLAAVASVGAAFAVAIREPSIAFALPE